MTNLSGANLNSGATVGPQGEGRESPSNFPAYPAYKDSGVEWLGEVPLHWQIKALRYLSVCLDGKRIPLNGEQRADKQGDIPYWGANAIMDYVDEAIFDEELLLVGEDGAPFLDPLKPVAFHSSGPVWPNNHIHVLRPNKPEWVRFLVYAMNAADYANYIEGSTRQKLNQSRLMGMPVSWPSYTEQTQIARFLDHETARIDALIEEQQRLIELLKEKRQAVISHAVTKGLAPMVAMKDSGVEWLGEVPAHWQVGALGYFAGIDTGATPDRGNPEYWDGDIPWIKTGEVNYENISQAEEHITWEGVKNSAAKVAPKGTLLMAMYGQGVTRGRVAILEIEAAYNQACAGIFVDDRVRVEYLRLFFIAAYPYIRDGGNETSQMNLSSGHIAKIKITVPPINEQISAEHFLNAEMVRFDSLIIEAGLLAQHLQERRSALISAAVTGKIDVRGWQPPASAPTPELAQEAV